MNLQNRRKKTMKRPEMKKHIDRMFEIIGRKPGVFQIEMQHDNDCPALKSHRMLDCTCSPIIRRRGKHAGKSIMAS
jgi:hypothetical protein